MRIQLNFTVPLSDPPVPQFAGHVAPPNQPLTTATMTFWPSVNATQTLLLWCHGAQGNPNLNAQPPQPFYFQAPPLQGAALGMRNYAFTVPFDYALFNPTFTQNPALIETYIQTFQAHAVQFAGILPALCMSAFYAPDPILNALDAVALNNLCDIGFLTDLNSGVANLGIEYIMLEQLMRAPVPPALNGPIGQTFFQRYDSILLFACRSSVVRGVGLGGAPIFQPAPPIGNAPSPYGLFNADSGNLPLIPIPAIPAAPPPANH